MVPDFFHSRLVENWNELTGHLNTMAIAVIAGRVLASY
jgi:hypothetical protein